MAHKSSSSSPNIRVPIQPLHLHLSSIFMNSSSNSSRARARPSGRPSTSSQRTASSSQRRSHRRGPDCNCEEPSRLRVAKTKENYGRLFWGCKYWVPWIQDSGCGFFDWYVGEAEAEAEDEEEVVIDHRDMLISTQSTRIRQLESSLSNSNRWLKQSIGCCVLMLGIIVVLVLMLYKTLMVEGHKLYLK